MSPLDTELNHALAQRRSDNLYRRRLVVEATTGIELTIDGKQLLSFCSNDYLGLANHPKVIEAFTLAAKRYGVGSGASHLVSGHSKAHHALEEALAEYTGRDRALLFSTGYMANIGVINALLGKQDAVFEDKLNHASLIDGGLSSHAKFSRYQHNDMTHLHAKLVASKAQRKLIVSDGIFSMDGDLAPVAAMTDIAQQHQAIVMIDDAHGFGVTEGGRGFSVVKQEKLPVYMATLGKGIGSFGAFVAGSDALIETLIQHARTYIYTTALPPAVAAATHQALILVQEEPWRQTHLHARIEQFKTGAARLGLDLMPSNTAIQPLLVGDSRKALALSAALRDKGFLVIAIRPPTVPAGSARLRVTLSAAHSAAQIDSLLNALAELSV